jgi:hypothetical protein
MFGHLVDDVLFCCNNFQNWHINHMYREANRTVHGLLDEQNLIFVQSLIYNEYQVIF